MQFATLPKAFQHGLSPGEQLQVKVPFAKIDGGREYMWVEWEGCAAIHTLCLAQIVEARQSEVFDYLRRWPDGRPEGNETSKLLK